MLPEDVVVGARLTVGQELDRPRAREIARELRRWKALTVATRALRDRDLSAARLAERLERAGVRAAERADAVATLARAGFVDDDRFAASRARALAERGYGDAAIRLDLEREGVSAEQTEAALALLEPERDRAERLVARRERSPATARYLARRGFAEDAVESVVGPAVAESRPAAYDS